MGLVDGTIRLIERVIKGGRSDDSVQNVTDDKAWDEVQAADIDEGLRSGRIKMLSAEESQEAIDALKKKWDIS